jgi:hypothetical protein
MTRLLLVAQPGRSVAAHAGPGAALHRIGLLPQGRTEAPRTAAAARTHQLTSRPVTVSSRSCTLDSNGKRRRQSPGCGSEATVHRLPVYPKIAAWSSVMFQRSPASLAAAWLLCLMVPLTAAAERTDVVVLVNGNSILGEVKGLEFGVLSYGTDSMGTVQIDWEDVVSVTSDQDLQIEREDGARFFGHLEAVESQYSVAVATRKGQQLLRTAEVVRITPIETDDRLLNRLDGSFTFGIQTQKSSEVTTSNLASDVSYRTRAYLVGLRFNSSVIDQPSEPTAARQNFNINYQRFRKDRWFTDFFTGWEKNDELGIQARVSAGGALGRYLVQTNRNQFSVAGGVQGARTSFTGEDDSTAQAEGRIEIRYLRRHMTPDSSLRFTSTIYPLIEDLRRYRAESDLRFRRELFADLFFEFGVGFSYISDPPTGAASTDYIATTSLGYSF